MTPSFRKILTFLLPLLLFSCTPPMTYESFVRIQDKEDGNYVFQIPCDSASVRDLGIFTRIDCPEHVFSRIGDLQVKVGLLSPSGKEYEETVYLPQRDFHEVGSGTWVFRGPYRDDVMFREAGIWTFRLEVPGDEDIRGFRGIGLITERKQD